MGDSLPKSPSIRRFLVAALLWLVVGVAMGAFFATSPGFLALKHTGHDFELIFASVHSHVNLLGWLSNALFALTYWMLPRLAGRPLYSERLAAWHFALLNIGLAGMMAALFAGAVAGAQVFIAGRDLGADLFGPGNLYLPHAAFQSVLRWGIPFAALVLLGAGAFLVNVWLTWGLRPTLARPANRLRELLPAASRWAGLGPVPEAGIYKNSDERSEPGFLLQWFFKISTVWLVAGVLLGGLYGSPPLFAWLKAGGFDFESLFASVHSHMTVMGWAGNGLFGALYGAAVLAGRTLPERRLRLHLWLYNLGLAGLLALLALGAYQGRSAYVGATGSLTEAQRFYPFETALGVLRLALPFALLLAAGLWLWALGAWPRGAEGGRPFLRAGMVWFSAGLALEGLLSLDPAFFWQKRSGHEFETMLVVAKDHAVMLGGLSGLTFGLLYALLPKLSLRPRLVAAHFWLLNAGLAGFLLFYGLGGYAGGTLFQTVSNPYGPGGYLPYLAALDLTRFGTPFALAAAASLILFAVHTWRAWPRLPTPAAPGEP